MPGSAAVSSVQIFSSLTGMHSYWPYIATALGNGYFFVLATTLSACFLIGVCVAFKYTPYLLTDFRNASNNEIPELAIRLWLGFILILPVFLDAGPMWFVIWWFFIFWGYSNRSEKRFAVMVVFLLVLSSWIAHVGAGLITYTKTQVNKEIFLVEHGLGSASDVQALSNWVQAHAADAEPMNAQAMAGIQQGNYTPAVALLTHALDIEPTNPRYYNHLGIALAGLGKHKEALNAFTNATTLDARNVIYYYNASKVHLATYNIMLAEQAIDRASKIDPERTSALLSQEVKNQKVRYIMETVPSWRLIARQMRPSDTLKAAADDIWHLGFGIIDRSKAVWVGIAILVLLILQGYLPEEKYTKMCSRCGNTFYVGTTSKQGHPMCLQCNWLETKTKKQVNAILQHKLDEIKTYRVSNRIRTAKIEMVLPGLGSLMANRTSRGVTWLFLISAAVILVITGGQYLYSFIPSELDLRLYSRILGAALGGLLYWRAYKSPPIHIGG